MNTENKAKSWTKSPEKTLDQQTLIEIKQLLVKQTISAEWHNVWMFPVGLLSWLIMILGAVMIAVNIGLVLMLLNGGS